MSREAASFEAVDGIGNKHVDAAWVNASHADEAAGAETTNRAAGPFANEVDGCWPKTFNPAAATNTTKMTTMTRTTTGPTRRPTKSR